MEQDSDRILLNIKTRFIKPEIVRFPIIDSTNSYLMNAHSYKSGTVVLADYQTAGRGRFDRSWISPPEEALLFSILLTDLNQEIPLYIYTFLAAVGVCDGLNSMISGKYKLSLKWPNDILLNNNKVCGILVQSKTSGSVSSRLVIGIGLNVNQPEVFFRDELQHATSLYSTTGKRFDRFLVLTNILQNIDQQLILLYEKGARIIFNKWKNACDSIGRPVAVDDGERIYKGIFEDISENGGFVLNTGVKKVIFHAADVTILKKKDTIMILVVDIGNTNTVIGIYQEERLLESWRLASSHARTVDEYWMVGKLLCNDAGINTADIKGVIIGSVVPELTKSFVMMSRKYFSLEPVVVGYQLNLGMKLLVREPKQVGADRICNAVAGKHIYTLPLIIVDLGTATTFDVINKNGDYIGGAISPGLITGSLELIRKASQLHEIELIYPENIIGKTTKEHLQSGIFVGHIAMIEGIIERIKSELSDESVKVVATGGYCEEVVKNTSRIDIANLNLTLEGLRLIYNFNS